MVIWRASEAHEASLAPQDPLVSQDCLVNQGALGSTAPMLQDLQAFLVCLGRKGPLDFLVPQDLQVLQAKRAHREWLARKAVLARWASQDPRGAKEILGLSVYLERLAWLDPLGQSDHQDHQDPRDHQDQDLPLDLMIWKVLGCPSRQQPKTPTGCRDLRACQDSRGILEWQGHLEPREKLEQMESRASLASQEERVQLGPRDQKERKGPREKRETQEKTEWGCQASLAPQDLQGL